MAENRSKSDGFMLRFPPGLRDRVKSDADGRGRSMNAEIVWRIEKFEEAQRAWVNTDAEMSKLERAVGDSQAEVERLYEERAGLFEAVNNQERSLQSLRESHRTLAITVKSLGEALLTDSQISDFVRVLAEGLTQIEIDLSSDASEPVPKEAWER
ncbi:Arc family DNA-binding protein [Phyllobacterium chamaecytisi]|uniref:Arc family DNA-binding protein n=1 Tax=Phyllobacterium chamaecytisi TaxID=2876082 RepID=UPI001CC975D8|nr:Arc family DNA-binding protein [Phyllobacterium sp. KW56]MBZ9603968.1 Arc family DNA-binding protein [Phyllobacterium sp. KW56]